MNVFPINNELQEDIIDLQMEEVVRRSQDKVSKVPVISMELSEGFKAVQRKHEELLMWEGPVGVTVKTPGLYFKLPNHD